MNRICRSICLLLPSPLLRRPLTEKDKVDEMTRKCQFAGRNYVLSKDVRTVACGRFAASNREGRAAVRGAILLWEISTGEKGTEVDRRVVHQRATYAVLPPSFRELPTIPASFRCHAARGQSRVWSFGGRRGTVCRVLQSSERLLTRNSFPLPPFRALRPLVSVEIGILGRERTENFCKRPPKPTSDHESLVLNGMAHKS